jgi:hypothetical protein
LVPRQPFASRIFNVYVPGALTLKLATFPAPEIGPVLNTVDPLSQVAVPVPVDELPVRVMLVALQVRTPLALAAILTVGAWLF